MTGRIFNCETCGKETEDHTIFGTQRFCCDKCARIARTVKPTPCPHNPGVRCKDRECASCGWNPVVARRRRAAFARKQREGSP